MKYIQTVEELETLAKQLATCSDLAIDLECENNLHYYGTYICIIQISDGKDIWIVDAITIQNMQPLCDILENPRIMKVFHDVNFDFRILNAQYNCTPKNTFDTKIAADVLGREKPSFDVLIREFFNTGIQTKGQKADWTKRPIPKNLLEYAAFDVLHLLQLKDKLIEELTEKKLLDQVLQKCSELDKKIFTMPKPTHTNLPGYKKMPPAVQKRVEALFAMREKTAQKANKPAYMIMHNKTLITLAQNPPKTLEAWKSIKGVHPAVKSETWFKVL